MANQPIHVLTIGGLTQLLDSLADDFSAAADRLNHADSILGDGDHGTMMARGCAALRTRRSEREEAQGMDDVVTQADATDQDDNDAGQLLEQAGTLFMNSAGGVAGPLFATLLLELGRAAVGQTVLTVDGLAQGTAAALERIQQLGHAKPGDKTLIDALAPAVQSLADSVKQGLSANEASGRAATAARGGAESTIDMTAHSGRARFVEGAGFGYPDPGALSIALFFETLDRIVVQDEQLEAYMQ